jgi:hypothetical protein
MSQASSILIQCLLSFNYGCNPRFFPHAYYKCLYLAPAYPRIYVNPPIPPNSYYMSAR